MNPKDIRIIINSRDRVTPLRQMVEFLLRAGQRDIVILDNDSAYGPLLEYYRQIRNEVRVVMLHENHLSKMLWTWEPCRQYVTEPFVYADSDAPPDDMCPLDAVGLLIEVAGSLSDPNKVGLGLRIDDIPDSYTPAPEVRKWEGQHWQRIIGHHRSVPLYDAGIATTFAFYPKLTKNYLATAVRTGFPYVAKHHDWYIDSDNPTEEQLFYDRRASRDRGTHNWGINDCYSLAVKRFCL